MSRQRGGPDSGGPTSNGVGHDLDIKFLRLSRPFPVYGHDLDHPEQPPLPQMQLSIPRTSQPIYVGEQFTCAVAVQLLPHRSEQNEVSGQIKVLLLPPSLEKYTVGNHHGEIVMLKEKFTVTKQTPYKAFNLGFEIPEPGVWTVTAEVRYNNGHRTLTSRFPLNTAAVPAISVRTKVSRSSSGLQAYVLETQIENLTDSLLVIENCALVTVNEWQVTNLTDVKTESVMLRSKDVYQYSFILRGGISPDAGQISVAWRREPLGAKGWQKTGIIRI